MPTLRELMGDLTRGDGRRFFNLEERFTFEPIFKAHNYWYGIKLDGDSYCANHVESKAWEPYTEPKEKKKVKLYRPIIKEGFATYWINDWVSNKDHKAHGTQTIVGWQEMEVEVDK